MGEYNSSHSIHALKHAVLMSGGSLREGEEQTYYSNARLDVDQAEQETDDVAFPEVETIQTLILIARRELAKGSRKRAFITVGRAMRGMILMGGHQKHENAQDPGIAARKSGHGPIGGAEALLQEVQRSWWALYIVDSFCKLNIGASIDSDQASDQTSSVRNVLTDGSQITTMLPQPYPSEPGYPRLTLKEFEAGHFNGLLTPMSGMAIAAALTHDMLKHRQHTLTQSLNTYNFCFKHECLEKMIEAAIDALGVEKGIAIANKEHGDTMLARTAVIVLLGHRILLHFIAIAKARTMHLMQGLISRSQEICLATAQRISEHLEALGLGKDPDVCFEAAYAVLRPVF